MLWYQMRTKSEIHDKVVDLWGLLNDHFFFDMNEKLIPIFIGKIDVNVNTFCY